MLSYTLKFISCLNLQRFFLYHTYRRALVIFCRYILYHCINIWTILAQMITNKYYYQCWNGKRFIEPSIDMLKELNIAMVFSMLQAIIAISFRWILGVVWETHGRKIFEMNSILTCFTVNFFVIEYVSATFNNLSHLKIFYKHYRFRIRTRIVSLGNFRDRFLSICD